MVVNTVLDVLNAELGEVFPAVKGKITKLYNWREQPSAYGTYSIQNGEISDGTNTIRLALWNQPDCKKFLNRQIYIEAGMVKNKLGHVVREDNEYPKGTFTPQLRVDKNATISTVPPQGQTPEDSDNPELNEDPRGHQEQKPKTPPKEERDPSLPVTVLDLDKETRKDAIRLANLRLVAERAADLVPKMYKENGGKRSFTEADTKEIATGIFIELYKMGHAPAMPFKPVVVPEQQPPPVEKKPEPPPEI